MFSKVIYFFLPKRYIRETNPLQKGGRFGLRVRINLLLWNESLGSVFSKILIRVWVGFCKNIKISIEL